MSIGRVVVSRCIAIASLAALASALPQAPSHAPVRPISKQPTIPEAPPIWIRSARLAPADPVVAGSFGQAVAVDDDTIATRQRGNAYVFVRDAGGVWSQQARLVPPNADNSTGQTVAIDGDNLVIGRPQDDAQSLSYAHGTAFIYHRTGTVWALEAATSGLAVGQVGLDVEMVGDVAAITGALTKDSINIRRRTGPSWPVVSSINCCPGSFGSIRSIAMDQTTFLIAGASTSSGQTPGGGLHVYNYNGQQWVYAQTLPAPHAVSQDQYGSSTDMSGDHAVVGAPAYDDFGAQVGAVFVYARENGVWHQDALLGPCESGVREFGRWAVIHGSTIAVSAQELVPDEELQTYRSVAYVYELTPSGWTMQQRITIPEAQLATEFGASLELDARTLVIGSMSEDVPVTNAGAAYVFERQPSIGENFCFGDGSGTACPCGNPGSPGNGCASAYSSAGARLDAYGAPSISDDRVVLSYRGVPPGANAFFYQGDAREQGGAGSVLMDGLRCITGSVVLLGSVASCHDDATFPSANDPSLSTLGAIPAGATRYYQVAYASIGPCGTGTNFTNAAAIAWTP